MSPQNGQSSVLNTRLLSSSSLVVSAHARLLRSHLPPLLPCFTKYETELRIYRPRWFTANYRPVASNSLLPASSQRIGKWRVNDRGTAATNKVASGVVSQKSTSGRRGACASAFVPSYKHSLLRERETYTSSVGKRNRDGKKGPRAGPLTREH